MPTNQLCHPQRGTIPIVIHPVVAQVRAKPHISTNVVVVVVVGLAVLVNGLTVKLADIVVVCADTIYEVIYVVCGDSHMFAEG